MTKFNRSLTTLLAIGLLISIAVNGYLLNKIETLSQTSEGVASYLDTPPTAAKTYTPTSQSTEQLDDSDNHYQAAQTAFYASDFSDAFDYYHELYRVDEQAAIELRQTWLRAVDDWLLTGDLENVNAFLTAALHYQPYALDFLERQSLSLRQEQRLLAALEVYYEMLANAFDEANITRIKGEITAVAHQYITQLKQTRNWQRLIEQLNWLLSLGPDDYFYQYELILAHKELRQFDAALQQLDVLQGEQDNAELAELRENLEALILGQVAVPLKKVGSHYIVNGNFGTNSSAELMIDTGASLSVLTQQHFDEVSQWQFPEYIRDGQFNTAGGLVSAPIYRFDYFEIAGFVVTNIEFAVIALSDFKASNGLLGMNFLQNFKFQIDQQNAKLLLQHY